MSSRFNGEVADLPEAWLKLLQSDNGKTVETEIPEVIPHGKQHHTLISVAGTLRNRGMTPAEIFEVLKVVNKRCEKPGTEEYLRKQANTTGQWPQGKMSSSAPADIGLTPASEIHPKRVKWLIQELIPLSAQSVICGEGGLGKSTYVGGFITARVTRGETSSDVTGRDVLIVSAEDAWPEVIVPRLIAHGADLTRVHRVDVKDGDGRRCLTLPDDLANIEKACVDLKDGGRPVALVVIDPITAFLSDRTDSHKDASVRRALAPLAGMAERLGLAVITVAHLNKNEGARVLSRLSGSIAFQTAARSVVAFARNPEDPEGESGRERVVVHAKTNWGRQAESRLLRLETKAIRLPEGELAETSFIRDLGETSTGIGDLQNQRDEDHSGVEEAIAHALETGPRPSNDVKAEVKTQMECSSSTVQRAATRMVKSGLLVISDRSGFQGQTAWSVPVKSSQSSHSDFTARDSTGQTRIPGPKPEGVDPQSSHVSKGEPTGDLDPDIEVAEQLALRHADMAMGGGSNA